MRHLSLVPPPVARTEEQPPASTGRSVRPAAYVPVRLLLAASGRCSCDACCADAVHPRQPRRSRHTDRPPVRDLHLLG